MTVLENVMEAPVQVLGLSKQEARERAVKYRRKWVSTSGSRSNIRCTCQGTAAACFHRPRAGDGAGSITV